MFKFAAPLVAAMSFATGAFAECTGPGVESLFSEAQIAGFKAESAAIPYSNGIYWRAEKDGTEINVAGTLHIYAQGLEDIAARFQPALAQADLVMFEITPADEAALEQAMMTDTSMLLLPRNRKLPQVLSVEKWLALSAALSRVGVDPTEVAAFQPWIINMNFLLPPCALQVIEAGEPGMEDMLQAMTPEGTPMASLEDWRVGLGFFSGPDFDRQADELLLSLATLPYLAPVTVETVRAYFDGDPQVMGPVTKGLSSFIDPGLRPTYDTYMQRVDDELLEGRNKIWVRAIETAAKENDRIFVAVGAMHLGGETGVIGLLAENGWAVSPMPE